MYFPKTFVSCFKFHRVCLYGTNLQWVSIISVYGLAPSRLQGIDWINYDLVEWRIYTSPDFDMLQ